MTAKVPVRRMLPETTSAVESTTLPWIWYQVPLASVYSWRLASETPEGSLARSTFSFSVADWKKMRSGLMVTAVPAIIRASAGTVGAGAKVIVADCERLCAGTTSETRELRTLIVAPLVVTSAPTATAMSTDAVALPLVAVIFAWPPSTAVTNPAGLTSATFGSLVAHVTCPFEITAPDALSGVAINWAVSPASSVFVGAPESTTAAAFSPAPVTSEPAPPHDTPRMKTAAMVTARKAAHARVLERGDGRMDSSWGIMEVGVTDEFGRLIY
jgi:hypothetical protein